MIIYFKKINLSTGSSRINSRDRHIRILLLFIEMVLGL